MQTKTYVQTFQNVKYERFCDVVKKIVLMRFSTSRSVHKKNVKERNVNNPFKEYLHNNNISNKHFEPFVFAFDYIVVGSITINCLILYFLFVLFF